MYMVKTILLVKYSVQVVFCIDNKSDLNNIRENIGHIPLVSIGMENMNENYIAEFVWLYCNKAGCNIDKKDISIDGIDRNNIVDCCEKFIAEYQVEQIYTAYSDLHIYENRENEIKISAQEELNSLVGLDNVKKKLVTMANYLEYRKKNNPEFGMACHLAFMGNPGTAKTTAAILFAKILSERGIIKENKYVELSRSGLVGKYVGWTSHIVDEKFAKARGGVLFIDEAYSLCDDRSGSFGDEAINAIVSGMENNRENTIVILAGYTIIR